MTEDQAAIYLQKLRECGLEATAARAVGMSLRRINLEYADDPGLQEAALDAIEEFNDTLEKEAIRRARDGVEKPVFYKGDEVGTTLEFSDSLMAKLLTGRRAAVYGNKQEISGPGGAPLTVSIRAFPVPPPETPALELEEGYEL